MKLKIGDIVEVECVDMVVASGWNERAETEHVYVYGRLHAVPNPKSKKPQYEIISMTDKGMQNANQSTAIPAGTVTKIRKLQYTRGLADLT